MGGTRLAAELPVIAVASGKGGVGKTSLAVTLARQLSAAGHRVGLVDADLYGPDVPRMLGIRRDVPATSITIARWGSGRGKGPDLEAAEIDGLKVASVGFLVAGNQGIAVGSAFGDLLLRRLVFDTDWGDVDGLLIDMPPGTGEVHQALLGLFGLVGVLLVVTPAEVAHLDTNRALTVFQAAHAKILGGIENMAYLQCDHCGERTMLHSGTPYDRTIWSRGVTRLASLPYLPDAAFPADELDAVTTIAAQHFRDQNGLVNDGP